MKNIAIVVEGQTEEAFVKQILQPGLGDEFVIEPIVVQTSRAASGRKQKGGGTWRHYERDIRSLLGQSHRSLVTTMLDFYGYPTDGPGRNCCTGVHNPRVCVRHRAAAMTSVINNHRILPFILLHEFETLIFAAAADSSSVLGDSYVASCLKSHVTTVSGDVELLNDSPSTSPSHRVRQCWPGFSKTIDGIAVIEEAGLESLIPHCPGLSSWLTHLNDCSSR